MKLVEKFEIENSEIFFVKLDEEELQSYTDKS